MKESISYTFLLNIIITFIFICFTVIMGIFSYYRAFRANTAILNAIEKYEGFNCLSIKEIDKNLKNIGYNVPFKANKKNGTNGTLLTEDDTEYGNLGYSVIYYDNDTDNKLSKITFSSSTNADVELKKEYQYGVFTYMYMDLPIINNILKIPVFGKTNKLYEFRNLVSHDIYGEYDIRLIAFNSIETTETMIKIYAAKAGTSYKTIYIDPRLFYKLDINRDGIINSNDRWTKKKECGTYINYSIYGGI